MKNRKKVWLVIAVTMVILGMILFGGVMSFLDWDFSKLSSSKFETNTYEIREDFSGILIKSDTARIIIAPSDSGEEGTAESVVTCYENSKTKHSVSVKDGVLCIELSDNKKWYEYIDINFSTPKITIQIPKDDYDSLYVRSSTGDVEVAKDFLFKNIDISLSTGTIKNYASASESVTFKTSTGNIFLESISARNITITVSTGEVAVSDVSCTEDMYVKVSTGKATVNNTRCNNFTSNGSTGDLVLKNILLYGKMKIERSTGDVKLDNADASEIFIKTDTGNIVGSLASEKVFIARSDTGKIDVPKTTVGGICELTTDTGDIKITIK